MALHIAARRFSRTPIPRAAHLVARHWQLRPAAHFVASLSDQTQELQLGRWLKALTAANQRAAMHTATIQEHESGQRYKNVIKTGKHEFIGDLAMGPAVLEAAGPEPKELALASIGLCTSMTVRLYADRKKWDLKRVRVEVKEMTEKNPGHVPDGLELALHVEGNLTQEQRERLLEVANSCPVKRMFMGKMPKGIVSSLGA